MASLQQIGDTFYVRFRFGGLPFRRSLEITDELEAEATKRQVELTLHRIKTGVLPPPPAGADPALYVLSGGKVERAVVLPEPPPVVTLRGLWDGYRASMPPGSKDSLPTEAIHFRHLFRLVGGDRPVSSLTTDDLQDYINGRLKEAGLRGKTVAPATVRSEIATLSYVWDSYGLARKKVPAAFDTHFGLLNFGKGRTRPPFQTWEQIERRVQRGSLCAAQAADLWDCLFLDLGRIAEVLEFVRTRPQTPACWLYPMFVFAAHTGARRSEMIRSEVDDWDLDHGVVQIREKKRDKDVEFTFRHVAVSPMLAETMQDWFRIHTGGPYTLCAALDRPVTRNMAAKAFRDVVDGTMWNVLHGWHLFRHSLASNMALQGIDQRMIDATLGHQTEEMRRRYRHLFPSQQRAVMASIFASR